MNCNKYYFEFLELTGLYKAAFRGDANGIMSIVKVTILMIKCHNKCIIYALQRDGHNAPLNELDENGCTPLMYAALSDSDSAIEMLLNFSARREEVNLFC